MTERVRSVALPFALMGLVLLLMPQAVAEDEAPPKKWTDVAELNLVATGGNTESTSLGFKNDLFRDWEKAKLIIRAGGIRVESTVGQTVTAGSTDIDTQTAITAESYYLNGRYGRNISDRFVWYVGAGWNKDEFAGIANRYLYEGGVGNVWYDTDDLKFATTYGITYTDQEDVIPNPALSDTYMGWRVGWNYENKLGKTTTYDNLLTVDGNLDETSDWRVDMYNGLAVTMSERMALKVGLQLLYRNQPSLGSFVEVDGVGDPTGNVVTVPLEELDTILTVGLVMNFK